MKLLLGGDSIDLLFSSLKYEGVIGIAYSNIITGFLTVLLILLFTGLAIIGLVQVVKWIGWGFPKKKK